MPLVSETAALPRNGLRVASTFSGCGGSCYGYRLAGFDVVWANEFVPIAQESYKANHPTSVLDPRDIKIVQPEEILSAIGMKKGELDLFDGSPPCQAFSTQGQRAKGWGKEKVYEHGARQKNEDLFFEYVRLLDGLQPKVFVAENVSGLVKGAAKGYFKLIHAALQKCGYRVEARLLDAQWLGVPQSRSRIIFIGVQKDLGVLPSFPAPLPYRYSIGDALPHLMGPQFISGGSSIHSTRILPSSAPSPTIATNPQDARIRAQVVRDSGGAHAAGAVSLEGPAPTIPADRPATFQVRQSLEVDTGGTRLHGPIQPEAPSPTITTQVASHFKVRTRLVGKKNNWVAGKVWNADDIGPIVTAGGIGGGFADAVQIEEPSNNFQARQLTIPEVMRLCSFPDDYVLKGTFSQQWERLGNSVPPVMMQHIASHLRDSVFPKIK